MSDILDTEFVNYFYDVIRLEFRERDVSFANQREQIARQAAVHGRLRSGNAIHAVIQLLAAESKIRAEIICSSYFRGRESFGFYVVSGSSDAAQLVVVPEFLRTHSIMVAHITTHAPFPSDLIRPESVASYIEDGRAAALARLKLQFREWEYRGTRMSNNQQRGDTTITITGNGNLIQSGQGNWAVQQILDASGVESLLAALVKLQQCVQDESSFSSQEKAETLALIATSIDEARKPEPSGMVLKSLVKGTVEATKGIAALSGAVKGVHDILVLLGWG